MRSAQAVRYADENQYSTEEYQKNLSTILSTMAADYKGYGSSISTKRWHRDQLPPPPAYWKQLSYHAFGREFKEAAIAGFDQLHVT
jgi:hypothetical protein